MKTISENRLKKYLHNKNVNILAFCITPWHLIGIKAYINCLMNNNIDLCGYICIMQHIKQGYLIDESQVCSVSNNKIDCIKIVLDNNHKNSFKKKEEQILSVVFKNKRSDKQFYIVNQWKPSYDWIAYINSIHKEYEVVQCVVDEGISTYLENQKMHFGKYYANMSFANRISHFINERIVDKLLEYCLKKNGHLKEFFLLIDENGTCVPNSSVVENYKKVFLQRNNIEISQRDLYINSKYENSIVINTQPLYEDGLLLSESDIDLMKKIIDTLLQNGESIIIKPHPREEPLRKYRCFYNIDGVVVDDRNGIPQEEIISRLKIKPKMIIGFTSTTLITLRLFFSIRTVSLIRCIKNDVFSEYQKNFNDNFVSSFKRIVVCPDKDELNIIFSGI